MAGSVDRAVKGGELEGRKVWRRMRRRGGGGECSPASLLLAAGKRVNGERVGGEGFSALRSVTRH